MKKIENSFLRESYFYETLDNGLKVIYVPKVGFKKSYAMLTVKFGSLNQEYKLETSDEIIKTPAGIAHFLEHKMFEMPNGVDASVMFAEYGADVNAYTSYDNTTYYFSTVTNFEQSLLLLLDFVQTPYFNKESVENEKGIIEQEIMSSFDKPNAICYQGILKCLFEKNKIIDDIGGTINSINEITDEHLKLCYETFYHPSNMFLIVVGDFKLENISKLINDNQKTKSFTPFLNPQTIYYLEDNKVNKRYDNVVMNVNIDTVNVGVKFDFRGYDIFEINKICIVLNFILDELFASTNYHKWLKEGLIDYSFDYSYSIGEKYAYLIIGGDVENEDLFIKTIKDVILSIPNTKFSETRFNNYLRSQIGDELRMFNSIESIARTINSREIDQLPLFNEIDTLQQMKFEDLKIINSFFKDESIAVFSVKNVNKKA